MIGGPPLNEPPATSCQACAVGRFSNWDHPNGTACHNCPAGSFANITEATVCSLCQVGKAGAVEAATSSAVCIDCSAGYVASTPGLSTCSACSPGKFTDGAGYCAPCYPGQYSNGIANTVCQNCTADTYTYSGTDSSSSCAYCIGSVSVLADNCTVCPPGTRTESRNSSKYVSELRRWHVLRTEPHRGHLVQRLPDRPFLFRPRDERMHGVR